MSASADPKIFHFMDERESIIREVTDRVVRDRVRAAERSDATALEYVLNEAAYFEMQRLEKGSSKLDLRPYGYWKGIARTVGRASQGDKTRILQELAEIYSRDVAGKFTPQVYKFATKVLPVALSALFNVQSFDNILRNFMSLSDRIIIQGELDRVRRLVELGTVIVVPTHSSNLDSIAVGWSLDEAGLPPVTYGAGKNLFTNPLTSFFMHNLGAYKVDRRIRHTLYKDVLKTYSEVLLERGYHSLFFPGGTRSRSNHIDSKLKLGLLGSGLTAYTNNVLAGRERPNIYVCPLTINYNLVLEAETLIADALRLDGGARFIIEDDEFADFRKVFRFVTKTMASEYTLYLHFGEPLDLFGNRVDDEGRSLDPCARIIDPQRYLWANGEVVSDRARDAEYTRSCGEAVVDSYRRNSVVMTTTFLAFVLYRHLADENPDLDLFRLLRVAKGEVVPFDAIYRRAELLRDTLRRMAERSQVHLSHGVANLPVQELVEQATSLLRTFHATPVVEPRSNGLAVGHANLLYYYHNRLEGYGLEEILRGSGTATEGAA